MSEITLSLIIPAYNEEKSIKTALLENLIVLENSKYSFEIIVIDDGSVDNTKKIIIENFSTNNNIIFLSKPNGGFGSAIKKGIMLSKGDYIMFAPVDNPLNNNLLNLFLSNIGKADILVSYRILRKGYSTRMKFNSWAYHLIISALFRLPLKDYNWIHLYKKEIFKNISIKNERIFMLAEVLIKAKWLNYSFYEFPVEMQERKYGKKTAASFKSAFYTFSDAIMFYIQKK
ncbi:MAG: glycosyltransferase family 2 protein [Bacteroidota bacterium]